MIRKFLRDPLAHFLIAGAAIWGVLSLAGEPVDPAERTITLTREQQAALSMQFERTMSRAPTDAELDAQIEQWVREEILYREALRLGLDQGDPVVRRRLATKMDELASAEVETAQVSDAVLEEWLKTHPERFRDGEQFTFSQAYYRDEQSRRDAMDGSGPESGHPISLPRRMDGATYEEIKAVFGSQFAAQITKMTPANGQPMESGYGFHLVDLEERIEGKVRPLAEVRDAVEANWRNETAEQRREQGFELLRGSYQIDIK